MSLIIDWQEILETFEETGVDRQIYLWVTAGNAGIGTTVAINGKLTTTENPPHSMTDQDDSAIGIGMGGQKPDVEAIRRRAATIGVEII